MEAKKVLTAIYIKTAFSAYCGYIQEKPKIDAVHYSLDEVKSEIESILDKWKCETGNTYWLQEEYRNL